MQVASYLALVQAIQNFGQGIVALLPIILIPIGIYETVKWAFAARAGLGKLTGNLTSKTQGLTTKARERAQQSNLYQRPQMARTFRKQERSRGNVEDYAATMTNASGTRIGALRARMLQRKAAGVGNAAGQQRAYVSGLSQQEKQEHEEASQAALVLEANRINGPGALAAVAAGGVGVGVDGRTVSGAGNRALQLAAMQKIIKAQDAEQLENLLMNQYTETDAAGNTITRTGNVDQNMLYSEMTKEQNYSTSKGAGAHFVSRDLQPNPDGSPHTRAEIDNAAAVALSSLAADKLATQDGPSWDSASRGFAAGVGDATTLAARQRLWDRAEDISNDRRAEAQLKGSARAAYQAILAAGRPIV
jgi:hypothetical protein